MRLSSFALVGLVFALPLSVSAETKTYTLDGMSCGSCVKSVKAQVCKIPGLEACEVGINKVTLTGSALDDKAVKDAVEKAGFTMGGEASEKAHH